MGQGFLRKPLSGGKHLRASLFHTLGEGSDRAATGRDPLEEAKQGQARPRITPPTHSWPRGGVQRPFLPSSALVLGDWGASCLLSIQTLAQTFGAGHRGRRPITTQQKLWY